MSFSAEFPGFSGCDFRLQGLSLGGVETGLIVPEWKLALDVGRGRRPIVRCDHIALTHTHMDHAGGLPYVLALRQLFHLKPPRVYVLDRVADALRTMVDSWEALQRHELACEIVPVTPGERYPIRKDLALVPFKTRHVVPSVGYTVEREVEKLRPELAGLDRAEIVRRRQAGEAITARVTDPLLSFTGDTLPEALDDDASWAAARVVVHEATFLDEAKPYEACRAGGHTHLRDLMERAHLFTGPHVVLSHFSQVHRWRDIPELLAPLAERITGQLYAMPTAEGRELLGPIGPIGPIGP
jgi:ribonuclease Z